MNVGFWLTDDDYRNIICPIAGSLDINGRQVAMLSTTSLCRPYFKGNISPQDFAARVRGTAMPPDNTNRQTIWQVGNEPNLPHEQWQGGRPAYKKLVQDVMALLPNERIAWAGMSPGVAGWEDWYRDSIDVDVHAVVAHVYGQTYEQLVDVMQRTLDNTGDHNVIIGECNFGPGAGVHVDVNAWADNVLQPFLLWVAKQPRIVGTLYFAYTWYADTPIGTPVDAKGTNVVQVITRAALEDVVSRPKDRAWWIWYVDQCGGAQGIIDACMRTNSHDVFVKAADGPYVWDQLTPELITTLNAAGINVHAWVYYYGGWIAGNVHGNEWIWSNRDEINAALHVLEIPGIAGFIVDAEAETEGRAQQAQTYIDVVRAAWPGYLAYAPLPIIDYHASLPYVQFNSRCDAVLPQWYSKNLDGDPPWTYARIVEQWDRWMANWTGAGQRVPILTPAGEAYGDATPESTHEFEQLVKQNEYESWSYWSLQHAQENGLLDTIADIAQGDTPEPPEPTDPTLDELRTRTWDLLDDVQALTADWERLGWPSTATSIWSAAESAKGHVRASKGEK